MSIYQSIFDLIQQHIYGGVELTADMNLVTTLLSTTACVFCFTLPFLIVWKVLKLIMD